MDVEQIADGFTPTSLIFDDRLQATGNATATADGAPLRVADVGVPAKPPSTCASLGLDGLTSALQKIQAKRS